MVLYTIYALHVYSSKDSCSSKRISLSLLQDRSSSSVQQKHPGLTVNMSCLAKLLLVWM